MKIAIGADHGGFLLKTERVNYLEQAGHTPVDRGTFSSEAVDYPDYSRAVAQALRGLKAERGILICGSGVGARSRPLRRSLEGNRRCAYWDEGCPERSGRRIALVLTGSHGL